MHSIFFFGFLSDEFLYLKVFQFPDRQLSTGDLRFTLSSSVEPKISPEEALESLCKSAVDDVRPDAPGLFSKFISALRQINYCPDLDTLYQNAKNGQICGTSAGDSQKILTDALPVVGTTCSVKLMVKIVIESDFDMTSKRWWFPSLNFIKHPEKEMLEVLLVRQKKTKN